MPIVVRGLNLELDEPETLLPEKAARRLRVPVERIRLWAIIRKSLDARRHDRLCFTYNIELALADGVSGEDRLVRRLHRPDVQILPQVLQPVIEPGREPLCERPVVVGFGPAGMFAGWLLAQWGYRPLILERGMDVTNRHRHVLHDYYRQGQFHPESNLLFGEGGAGTYSDGKLYTRLNDPRIRTILEIFYRCGADPEILIESRPHIGSDKLPGICRRMRKHIEASGGEVRFGARLDDLELADDRLQAIVVDGEKIACGPVLVGIGLSARDTYHMLARRGVAMAAKPFQLGVRIEHPQSIVDRWQYGPHAGHTSLPSAEYHLVAKKAAGRLGDCFSFCMCPGGSILPTNESAGQVATNGASRASRNGHWANSGLVVTLTARDLLQNDSDDPLAALNALADIERTAFELGGGDYRVPAQRARDLLDHRLSDGVLETSYPLGGTWTELRRVLPGPVIEAIAEGIRIFERRLPGFAGPDALVAAPETRASSPVRILRHDQTHESLTVQGLYPIGEGAGYAGGIISAALDGLKTAERIICHHARPC
ncbi:MAG: FAD-dependent oxidoreductase [Phycisphaerales bacterium]|nr:FAD-dependent oxidoreductase [Phycisphaerales bacterium]